MRALRPGQVVARPVRVRPLGWLATVAVVVATSLTIETAQAVLPLGRTADIDDVLLNTLGGVLGTATGSLLLRRRAQPQPAEVAQRPDA